MSDLPRIAGTFANFKLVKTRSVAVLEIEIPLEKADATLTALGGLPKPGAEQWVALAPLTPAAVEHDRKSQAQPLAEPLERKPLSLASKIALTCGQKSFCDFLVATRPRIWHRALSNVSALKGPACSGEEIAAEAVRDLCGVSSRRLITPGSDAAQAWHSLEADYHHWQRTGAAA